MFQLLPDKATAMDIETIIDGADDDDYVLTPLQPEAGDPEPDIGNDDGSGDEVADETVTAADDYVQSLVTIESNWESGKCCSKLKPINSHIFSRTGRS
jgi:hypothetical protein